MGKIRVKVLGDEEQEQEKQKQAKIKKEQKEARKSAGVSVEEKEESASVIANEVKQSQDNDEIAEDSSNPRNDNKKEQKKPKKEKFAEKKKAAHSESYQTIASLVDKTKSYTLTDALTILEKIKRAKFDETVELVINTIETGISGSVTLPHGSGKETRVAIADDKIIAQVEKGIIDFDILLAQPAFMSKLAKVARVLGPKGLMPNPKNGTVTQNPEEAAKKFVGGLISYKTEAKTPIIHVRVGKLSFGEKKLAENIKTVFASINAAKIKNITLKSTMSPGIKISL